MSTFRLAVDATYSNGGLRRLARLLDLLLYLFEHACRCMEPQLPYWIWVQSPERSHIKSVMSLAKVGM